MKKYFLILIVIAIALIFVSMKIQAQTNEMQSKRIPLPEGVTQEWLSTIKDENGSKISTQPEDSGDAFQLRDFNGLNAGDEYGFSVAEAGDVNGDGYGDIIIGAPLYSSLHSYGGRAYIYYGGINVNTVPDVILSGPSANLNFGGCVSTAGDVNGDGYSDVIVGATGFNNLGGEAMIYFGGASMNSVADLTITGDNIFDQFGISASTAGDVNGDGFSDVIIGANGYNNSTGRATIFFGGWSMDAMPDVILSGDTIGSSFGISVASAGDVNNDGFADVIVGANTRSENKGSAYIYYGGSNMNNVSDVTFTGQNAYDNFGTSVASSGDINGDSYNDVIIGAVGYNSATGIVYLYLGGANMDNASDVTLNGENTFDYFGHSVSKAGDLNGDGYSDVIIGAPYNSGKGKAYIYYGGISMNNILDMSLSGDTTNSYYGNCVAFAGDINGDGFPDLLAGAKGQNSNRGRVYLYMESMTGALFSNLTLNGEVVNSAFGYSVASAGDVNNDGYNDVIVGARDYTINFYRAYIFFGGINMDNTADVILNGETGTSNFGYVVSTAGDVNGDGYSDVIVGAYGNNISHGKAYIFYGGSSMDGVFDVTMTGEQIGNSFGKSVSNAGDVNGDGYGDVIIGAPTHSTAGRAYIFHGGSFMNNVADLTIIGETNSSFGISVSDAGDVNGDGYSDVIVGADTYNLYTGRAYIFYGASSMDPSADVFLTGVSTSNYFGYSVSSAGDLNGDGYSDVVVGAYRIWKSYIFYGGPNMDATADVSLTAPGVNPYFGISVSSAGDVNKDGFSDVMIGTSEIPTHGGKVFVYFGGLSMNNTEDITLSGGGPTNFFGSSVSEAGDVNGDGNADLIIGEPGSNSSTGGASIYYTSSPSIKPNLVSIKDVPNDQGGLVKIKWVKSAFDVPVTGTITSYLIERSVPPGVNSYQWEQIGTVLPTQDNLYYYFTCSTPADSGINGNSAFYFRVTAYTGSTTNLYRSNIMSGNSLDNLAPLQVQSFSANPVSNNIRLNWNRNHESDLKNYLVYRSTSSSININTEPVFATVTDSTFLDVSPLTGIYYYFIVAQDIHSNKSPVVSSESQNITVNLTAFIEGFYNSSSDTQVSDTLRAHLRNSTAPYAIVDSATAVLSATGSATLKFGNAPTGTYYIEVNHRNSIETWSKAGGENLIRGGSFSYDFSNVLSNAFGSNMKQIDLSPTKFAICSGDVNQDGTVDATDLSMIDNDASNFISGYIATDLTGDEFVDGTDFAIADNNAANFVGAITP